VSKVPKTVIERTKAHINNDALKLITNISEDMRAHIGDLLKEGEEAGRPIAATASKLLKTGLDKGVFKSARKRAYLIARTELHRARQEAAVDIYKAAKIEMVKWVGIPDDGRICEKCLALHGKNFHIDNVEVYPPLHPRCRCRLLPADYQLDIEVKKQKKEHVVNFKILPNPKDYKYVVKIKKFKKSDDLEKAIKPHKYIKRLGAPKAYRYFYQQEENPVDKIEKNLIGTPYASKALQIVKDINALGGSSLFVGGCVRDALLGKRSKDIDIEVYGVKPEDLQAFLQKYGKVDQVGKSFGVFKVSTDSGTYDVSIPRRESKVGKGHKGFMTEHDPSMTYREAAGRRDLTINALAYDPLRKTIVDEYGGLQDLKDRKLRATNPETFVDDSLRVLRVMRFGAQLGFTPDLNLVRLCRNIDLTDLPKERVFGELEGMLLKSENPSLGMKLIPLLGIDKILPELTELRGVEQEPDWHPEGDAWTHTLMVVDQAAKMRKSIKDPKEKLIFMLSALCHDLGKPETTEYNEKKDRVTSYGHDDEGAKVTVEFLSRLTDDVSIIDKTATLVKEHMKPTMFYHDNVPDAAIRRLAKKVDIPMLVMLSVADKMGRGIEKVDLKAERWMMGRFKQIGLQHPKALDPMVMGRNLIPLGIQPSKEMGRLLDKIYNAQLDGKFSTTEEGIEYARSQGWFDKPLVKSRAHKYIKRIGGPGQYVYTYKEEEVIRPKELVDETADLKTGQPITFNYYHNPEHAPKVGTEFAQDIEPKGKYINFHKPEWGKIDKFEYGKVTLNNPLVLEWKTSRHGGWKTDLSAMYGGKKGKALTEAIIRSGHDGIVTVDSKENLMREIVSLGQEQPEVALMEKPKFRPKKAAIANEQIFNLAVPEFKKELNLINLTTTGEFSAKKFIEAMNIVHAEINSWQGRLTFDGRGRLSIQVGNITGVKGIKGRYTPGIQRLELDKKYTSAMAHEYAHFIWDDNSWGSEFLKDFGLGTYEDTKGKRHYTLENVNRSELIKAGFDRFATKFKAKTEQQIEEGIEKLFDQIGKGINYKAQTEGTYELFNRLGDFYSSPDTVEKLNAMFTKHHVTPHKRHFITGYIYEPTEVFARAVEWYTTHTALSIPWIEEDPRYQTIVNEWGDKYLKTGIIKSLETDMEKSVKLYLDPVAGRKIRINFV
jgi:tRNA nucleotidyltransferase (CCA-adding enzyme)